MTSTQQNEARQAVRLLFDDALVTPHTQAQVETLYQARRLLEEFIESAGVLESSEEIVTHGVNWRGTEFKIGEAVRVYIDGQVFHGCIDAFLEYGVVNVTLGDLTQHRFSWSDIIHWNPGGSQENI